MSHAEALSAYKAREFEKAHDIWVEEADNSNDQAMTNLGLMYLKGEGVIKDFAKAKDWFEKASEYDNDSANYNLALMYQTPIGVELDRFRAIDYFRRAVKKNHKNATLRLAIELLRDRSDLELVKEGFECMLQAANSGHPMARVQIGGIEHTPDTTCTPNEEFRQKSTQDQLKLIDEAIEQFIRPTLIKDGGNITMLEYKNAPDIDIRLAYHGNCAGCSLGATSTYTLILDVLSKVIDANIRVYVL
jgi:uncharacterized protein